MVLPSEHDGRSRAAIIERELPKLSTSLLEVIGPILDEFPDEVSSSMIPGLAQVAWVVWNAEDLGLAEQSGVARAWDDAVRRAPRSLAADFDALLARRRELFGHDPRTALEPEVTGCGDELRIRVATADTPRLRAWLEDPGRPDIRAGLAPSFAEFVSANELDHRFVQLGLPCEVSSAATWSRDKAHLRWRGEEADWDLPPLATLFRGDARAPDAHAMARYPARFQSLCTALETTVLAVAAAEARVPLDSEVSEAYSDVRRGRRGRRPSLLRDALHQRATLELSLSPWSADEFEAAMRQLERSVRRHQTGVVSRDYAAFLHEQFAAAGIEAYS